MKYANEIEKEVKNTAYEEIFIEIVKNAKNDKLKKKLEEISLNGALTKKQKEEIYNCVLDYNKKISESFVNKIEDIYNKGVKDGNLQSYLSNISINEGTKSLKIELQNYILNRLGKQNRLKNSAEYIANNKKIEEIKVKNSDKLSKLYEFKSDLEQIEAYIVGFTDAVKILNER